MKPIQIGICYDLKTFGKAQEIYQLFKDNYRLQHETYYEFKRVLTTPMFQVSIYPMNCCGFQKADVLYLSKNLYNEDTFPFKDISIKLFTEEEPVYLWEQ